MIHLPLRPPRLTEGINILVARSSWKELCFCLAIWIRLIFQLPMKWAGTISATLRYPVLLTQAGTVWATLGMLVVLKYSSHSWMHERART